MKLRKTQEDGKVPLCSKVRKKNVIKKTILTKTLHRFNAILIKIPLTFCIDLDQHDNLWGSTKDKMPNAILNKDKGANIPDFKFYFKNSSETECH